MPQGKPQPGERYLHFKNKQYQVVTTAKHSETGEELVIYQALYGDFGMYARPLSMFVSEVDHEKYPQVEQKYRFQLMEKAVADSSQGEPVFGGHTASRADSSQVSGDNGQGVAQAQREHVPGSHVQAQDVAAGSKSIEDLLMDFYDAKSYEDKYKILLLMREDITDVMIDNMAVVMDLVIPEGELESRYEELKRCVRTYGKYEIGR